MVERGRIKVSVGDLQVLVRELFAVDGAAPRTVPRREVTPLAHPGRAELSRHMHKERLILSMRLPYMSTRHRGCHSRVR